MERECQKRLEEITEGFKLCHKALLAIGDETRQSILLVFLKSDFNGIRVGEIAEKTHLSRASVSHHLQVLKSAEIINMRREGTKNYYYLDSGEAIWKKLTELVGQVYAGMLKKGGSDPRKEE